MDRVDAHVHLVPASALGAGEPRLGSRLLPGGLRETAEGAFYALPPYIPESRFPAEGLIALMDACGVSRAVVQQTPLAPQNEETALAVARYPDRLAGAMLLEPGEGWEREMDYWHERGLGSVKLEMRSLTARGMYPGLGYGDLIPLFRRAGKKGLTVTIDPAPADYPVYDPEGLGQAVRSCGDTRFVLCHLAYPSPLDRPDCRERWERMAALGALPNCWLDVSAMPDFFDAEGWPYPTALALTRRALDRLGPGKLIWGSDAPGTLCRAAYPQLMDMFCRAGLRECELEALFAGSAERAYTLPRRKETRE